MAGCSVKERNCVHQALPARSDLLVYQDSSKADSMPMRCRPLLTQTYCYQQQVCCIQIPRMWVTCLYSKQNQRYCTASLPCQGPTLAAGRSRAQRRARTNTVASQTPIVCNGDIPIRRCWLTCRGNNVLTPSMILHLLRRKRNVSYASK